jgi:hypothetical protein
MEKMKKVVQLLNINLNSLWMIGITQL